MIKLISKKFIIVISIMQIIFPQLCIAVPPQRLPHCVIELNNDDAGLFSNLARITEWIYCIKNDPRCCLYINMNDAYNFPGNAFNSLFTPINDGLISSYPILIGRTQRFVGYPCFYPHMQFNHYPADGISGLAFPKYAYHQGLYTNPGFSEFRKKLHPIIVQYIRPIPEIQHEIDLIRAQLSRLPSDELPSLKIGLHIRYPGHHVGCTLSENEFLDTVEKDIDTILQSKDHKKITIYLATLLQPIIDRLSAKYNIVTHNTIRTNDLNQDWVDLPNAKSLHAAKDAIIDVWSLANCDEIYGGASNMILFSGHINPNAKISLLPSLSSYTGL